MASWIITPASTPLSPLQGFPSVPDLSSFASKVRAKDYPSLSLDLVRAVAEMRIRSELDCGMSQNAFGEGVFVLEGACGFEIL
jgi:hypothetical protein